MGSYGVPRLSGAAFVSYQNCSGGGMRHPNEMISGVIELLKWGATEPSNMGSNCTVEMEARSLTFAMGLQPPPGVKYVNY